ncbi:phospholipid carrier-dependent glycosyltransferase [Geovibrio thiophilus]|uniref:Phospholipid carrier-dependent glycosyltransferase n=1 Tax=Geovibrio thiophilus TaxID=139438 RepID=A0A3R5UZH9_9BACT|nr:phospholipid carrier-dependent glycosyltransferase [Geovibrio thiophilus]QAR33552.1 phospholipid carrier-dependent glycosyltransferase [Geovibrio thiophilus]
MAVFVILALVSSYHMTLFESTEGRYAEIAREMLVSGNFMIPEFNGITHFHKPPLVYWLIAAGMKIFGVNALGARFFGIAAAAAALIFTRKTAYLLTRDDSTSDCAVLAAGSSLLFMSVSRIVAIDIYITAVVIIALYIVFSAANGSNGIFEGVLFGLLLGMGFMLKGPVVLLFTVIPVCAAALYNKNYRNLFNPVFFFSSLTVFLLTGLPWYLYIAVHYDGIAAYFLGYQLVDRMTTEVFNRAEPWYFYPAVLFGLCPMFIYSLYGMLRERFTGRYSLWIFFFLPFLVFQVSESKLISYLAPFTPLLGILAASAVMRFRSHLPLFFGHLYMTVLILAPAASGYVLDYLHSYRLPLMLSTLVAAAVYITILGGYRFGRGFVIASAWTVLVISVPVYALVPAVEENVKGFRLLAEASLTEKYGERLEAVFYKTFLPSVSFYREEIVPAVFGKERELQFEKDEEYKRYYVDNESDAGEFFSSRSRLFIITGPEHISEIEANYGYSCFEEYKARKAHLYFCGR